MIAEDGGGVHISKSCDVDTSHRVEVKESSNMLSSCIYRSL